MTQLQNKLSIADVTVITGYIIAVIAVGLWSMFQSKRGTVGGYFLAGRFMTFLPVGMSLFASNIGSEHLVGLAGSGAATGIGVGLIELNALLFLSLLGFIFLPVYISSGVYTMPEYIHKRFGGNRIRVFLSLVAFILYIFTKLSVNLYSGALFLQQSVGWNLYVSMFSLLALTGICTVTGGLATVIYLDTMMAFVMVGGASILSYIGFQKIGGYDGLRNRYVNAVADEVLLGNTTCGVPRADSFVLLRAANSDMPWPGLLLKTTPIWYWCTDQVIVQRTLAAKSLSHAQGGTILASYIKILPMFIMVMPGMISRVLFPNEVGCVDPDKCFKICESRTGCTNIAMPKLVLEIMPSGLRGMMLAVMMAALMSDLTSIFNSASALFTLDLYRIMRKKAGTKELMIVGRVCIVVLCLIGVVWVPVLKDLEGGELFMYINAVQSYFSPPIGAVYLFAVLWKRSNEKGTFWSLVIGFIAGLVRMILDFMYRKPRCGEPDQRPAITKNIHFFYFALLSFILTGIACVIISLLTDPQNEELTIRTTFWTVHDDSVREDELLDEKILHENDVNIRRRRANSKSTKESAEYELQEKNGRGDDKEPVIIKEKQSSFKRVLYFICGFSIENEEEQKLEEENCSKDTERKREILKSLKQAPCVKKLLYINIVILFTAFTFFSIYFTVPDDGPTKPTIQIPNTLFIKNRTRPYI